MEYYEHNCPNCRCLNPAGPAEWMAAVLTNTPDPQGIDITTGQLYNSYLNWLDRNPRPNVPVMSQNQLTRWLRKQGVQFFLAGNKGNVIYGWSFRR